MRYDCEKAIKQRGLLGGILYDAVVQLGNVVLELLKCYYGTSVMGNHDIQRQIGEYNGFLLKWTWRKHG